MHLNKFFIILLRQHAIGTPCHIKTLFNLGGLTLMTIWEIVIHFMVKSDSLKFYTQQTIFRCISIIGLVLSCLFLVTVVYGITVETYSNKKDQQSFKKTIIRHISLILSSIIQIVYLPSILTFINLIQKPENQNQQVNNPTGDLLSIIIASTQLIIIGLHNVSLFSIKSKILGGHSTFSPTVIFWLFHLIFPFLIGQKWGLITFQILTFVITGWTIYHNPRICHQYDRWHKLYFSIFLASQIFIFASSFEDSSQLIKSLTFFCLSLVLFAYLLLKSRYRKTISLSGQIDKNPELIAEIYYNSLEENTSNVVRILLEHKKMCNRVSSCICHSILFQLEDPSTKCIQKITLFKKNVQKTSLDFVINFFEQFLSNKCTNELSKLKKQFQNQNQLLLLYCYILGAQKKAYTKTYLLLRQYLERWNNFSILFQIKAEILIKQIIDLKKEDLNKTNEVTSLYNQYWVFHQKYESFLCLIEQCLELVAQIWSQMIIPQPEQQKVFQKMKKFDSIDRKIQITYNSLVKLCPQQILQLNEIMVKYERVILQISEDKCSKIKNDNQNLVEKVFNQNKQDNQILAKQGRIFSKSLDNIVCLIDIAQEDYLGKIKYKNMVFKEILEQRFQINSLNEMILPELREKHSQHFKDFLKNERASLNHKTSILFIQEKENVDQIKLYEIWCQFVTFDNQILVAVFLNFQALATNGVIFIENQNKQIVYKSKEFAQFSTAKKQQSESKCPQTIFNKNDDTSKFNNSAFEVKKIDQFRDAELSIYNIEIQTLKIIESIKKNHFPTVFEGSSHKNTIDFQFKKNSQWEITSREDKIVSEVYSSIKQEEFSDKFSDFEKIYTIIMSPKNKVISFKVAIYHLIVTLFFVGFWQTCNVINGIKLVTVNELSIKVTSISELVSSVSEADTALKLLVHQAYFNDNFSEYQQGVENIQFFKKDIAKQLNQIYNDNGTFLLSIIRYYDDGTTHFQAQSVVSAIVNGFVKQLTFFTTQLHSSYKFSPILSQNPLPLTNVAKNYFQANYNAINSIFIQLFIERTIFFENYVLKHLRSLNNNYMLAFSIGGATFITFVCILSIWIRKKDQQIQKETFQIFQSIPLNLKSNRLRKVKNFKIFYSEVLKPNITRKNISNKSIDNKPLEKSSVNGNDSFFISNQNISSTNEPQIPTYDLKSIEIPDQVKQPQKKQILVFSTEKWTVIYLPVVLFLLPFVIYFMHLGIQNHFFTLDIENGLNLQNQLGWQKEFISGSRLYSLELGMYELPFDIGSSNVQTIDEIFDKMHVLKKEYDQLSLNSRFIKLKNLLDDTNICENLGLFRKSRTLGAKLTQQQCMSKRFGTSLQKGFHQALVLYLDTVREYSWANRNPFDFSLERRHQVLKDQRLLTIVYLGEYLHQIHQMLYHAYKQDLRDQINFFESVNNIVGNLCIALWVCLTYFSWKFIVRTKIQQSNLVRANFKLISINYLAKSNSYVEQITKGKIYKYFK